MEYAKTEDLLVPVLYNSILPTILVVVQVLLMLKEVNVQMLVVKDTFLTKNQENVYLVMINVKIVQEPLITAGNVLQDIINQKLLTLIVQTTVLLNFIKKVKSVNLVPIIADPVQIIQLVAYVNLDTS